MKLGLTGTSRAYVCDVFNLVVFTVIMGPFSALVSNAL